MSAARRQTAWTDAAIDDIAKMRAQGLSYGMAAQKLGMSRNALIGIANRQKARGDVRFGGTIGVVRLNGGKKAKPKRSRDKMVRLPKLDRVLRDLPLFSMRAAYLAFAPPTIPKTIVAVGRDECRYIAGDDHMCCGGGTDGGSYCGYHARLVYQRRNAA